MNTKQVNKNPGPPLADGFYIRLRKLWYRVFKKYRRLELRCLCYSDADKLIRATEHKLESERWEIAEEENRNPIVGVVWMERRERIRM